MEHDAIERLKNGTAKLPRYPDAFWHLGVDLRNMRVAHVGVIVCRIDDHHALRSPIEQVAGQLPRGGKGHGEQHDVRAFYGPIDIGSIGPDFIRELLDGLGAARIGDTHTVAPLAQSAGDCSPHLANANNANLHFCLLLLLPKTPCGGAAEPLLKLQNGRGVGVSSAGSESDYRANDLTGVVSTYVAIWRSSALSALPRQPSAIVADIGSGKISSSPFSTPSKISRAADSGEALGMSSSRVISVSIGPGRTACTRTPCPAKSARSACDMENAAAFETE